MIVRCTLVLEDMSPDPGDFAFDPADLIAIGVRCSPDRTLSRLYFRTGLSCLVVDPDGTMQDRWAKALGEMIQEDDE